MQALSDAKAGENYTIKWMFGLPEVLEFLHSHHVEEGGKSGQYRRAVCGHPPGLRAGSGTGPAQRVQGTRV